MINSRQIKPEVIIERIDSFTRKFGKTHLDLACHAAFPLALSPDLLYQIWTNFVPYAPWTAVADTLLSPLFQEVGFELYETNNSIRNLLLSTLENNESYGKERIFRLAEFLTVYAKEEINSSDIDLQYLAQNQNLTAMAYLDPDQAAKEMTTLLSSFTYESPEYVRLIGVIETLNKPLAQYLPTIYDVINRAKSAKSTPRGGNPYQAGVPLTGIRFYGREKEIREILYLLIAGVTQPILLRGSRRIGKTSILFQLRYLLTHEGELERLKFSGDDEIALRKIHPVLKSLQEIPGVDYIARWLQSLYMDICESVGINYSKEPLENEFTTDPSRAFSKYMNHLFEQLPEIRLLIMIDEWDEQRHLPELESILRAIMQNDHRINWIISSTWILRAEMNRYGSPLYGLLKHMEIKEMDWASASSLIVDPSNKIGVTWQQDAVVTLLDQTARRPYLIQLLCQEVIDALYSQSSNFVDLKIVDLVIKEFINTPQAHGQYFSFLWTSEFLVKENQGDAGLHWLGRLILLALDNSFSGLTYLKIKQVIQNELHKRKLTIPQDFFEEEFTEQMIELEHIFDAISLVGQEYKFSIPLAKGWFHHTVGLQPEPFRYAYRGMMQDYEKWKQTSGQ